MCGERIEAAVKACIMLSDRRQSPTLGLCFFGEKDDNRAKKWYN